MTRARDTASLPTGLYVDASNNVGVGTTSPSAFGGVNLQVTNSTIASVLVSDTTRIGEFLASSSGVNLGSRSNHSLQIVTNDTVRMIINTSGSVFIGTNATDGQNTGGLTIQGKDIELMQIMGAY